MWRPSGRRSPMRSKARSCSRVHTGWRIPALKAILVDSFRDKAIPSEYLRASEGQRWSLLQGLMDSDGCISREKSQSVYVSTIRQLAESVRELLWSLGVKNAMTVGPSLRYGEPTGETLYTIRFTTFDDQPTSRLKRKYDRRRERTKKTRSCFHYLQDIQPLPYRSGGAWTNGKARQGVYGGTRYEGAIRFAGLSELNFSNIAISQIELRVTFLRAGGSSTKNLTFYKATSNTISGAIRGASIGAISVGDAYGRTVTLTFNAGTNSGLFNTIRSYLSEGNRVLCIYVPRTRGTYSGGYCYDYLGIFFGVDHAHI